VFRSWYATCPRGAEPALESELVAIGAKGIRPGRGGVRFTGEREVALRGCLALRTALRVLEPVGEFAVDGPDALYGGVAAIGWEELIAKRQTIAVAATGRAPGLDHTRFVEQRVKDAIVDRLRERRGERPDVNLREPDVLVVIHLGEGSCSVSLDLAGDLLSNRGYRVRTVEAPLRESLAAAVLLLCGWDRATPLHDPLCGSGTIPIEAALLAANRAPNLRRHLACEKWPRTSDAAALRAIRGELAAREIAPPPILASDRDADAVAAARANTLAAGVPVRVFQRDVREIEPLDRMLRSFGAPPGGQGTRPPPPPSGQLVLNVPYGERLSAGSRKQLKSFYHSLGAALRRLEGHRIAVLSASEDFESAFGLRPRARRTLWNGPLRCTLYSYVP
jgi:23S rRNA (guanine2445-N2)-methyltransferase / 23S rRNA (guanine2069-N7)-methyltransferase